MSHDADATLTPSGALTWEWPTSFVVSTLLLVGLYYPSNVAPGMSLLAAVGFLISCGLLFLLALRPSGTASMPVCLALATIPILLFGCTAFSRFSRIAAGGILNYVTLCLLFALNLRRVEAGGIRFIWPLVNLVNLAAGFGIVLGVERVNDFIIANYSAFYEELTPNMLQLHKPVLTFATHSIAGFFLYLFFWINFHSFKATRKKLPFIFAMSYLVLLMALLSVSSLIFSTLGIIQIAIYFWPRTKYKSLWALLLVILVAVPVSSASLRETVSNGYDVVLAVILSSDNGFLGRFLPTGTLAYDLQYLSKHPFSPIGFTYREGVMFADSGIIEYVLRGSLPLLLLVYVSLWLFLKRSMVLRSDALFLFWIIVFFEVGFSILVFFRTLCLLPVFVVYLNSLRTSFDQSAAMSSA